MTSGTGQATEASPPAVRGGGTGMTLLLLLGLVSAAMLGAALLSQYAFGLAPCTLCHWQRWAHIAVIALAVIGLAACRMAGRDSAARARIAGFALGAVALGFLAGAGIAGFHAGVELHWWEGTSTCGSGTPQSLDDLKAQLMAAPLVRCDEVAFAFAGISMAGWNGILSLLLAVFAALVARQSLVARQLPNSARPPAGRSMR